MMSAKVSVDFSDVLDKVNELFDNIALANPYALA